MYYCIVLYCKSNIVLDFFYNGTTLLDNVTEHFILVLRNNIKCVIGFRAKLILKAKYNFDEET